MVACTPAPTPDWARPRVERPVASVPVDGDRARQEPVATPASPQASPSCRDEFAPGALARVSCSGDRIVLRSAIALHPARQVPTEPTRSALKAVAELMRDRPQLQLIRIEVYSNARPGDAEQARAEVRATQARADAVLRYLWRTEKVSAERMEAVGYGAQSRFTGASERWPLRIVIAQQR